MIRPDATTVDMLRAGASVVRSTALNLRPRNSASVRPSPGSTKTSRMPPITASTCGPKNTPAPASSAIPIVMRATSGFMYTRSALHPIDPHVAVVVDPVHAGDRVELGDLLLGERV